MKYYIIAGEASGDLHGSNLVKNLKEIDNQAVIRAWGGDLMQTSGAEIRKHYRDLAFMGFWEVLKNIRTISRNFDFCKQDILDFQPDAIIFIDYPGFNLRMAKWLRQQIDAKKWQAQNGRKPQLFYYISPQIWAWHTSRVHKIGQFIDRVFCILPFEQDFYVKYGYTVDFVGHPLLDALNNFRNRIDKKTEAVFREENNLSDKPIFTLMPGSRNQEIEDILPRMLSVITGFPAFQFVIAVADAQDISKLKLHISNYAKQSLNLDNDAKSILLNEVRFVKGKTYELLEYSRFALVKSGTSTLETALFDVPQIVCYYGSPISFAIAKRLVKLKFISLVNLIVDKEIVKELIQDEFNTENLRKSIVQLIENQENIKKEYAILRGVLGGVGASRKTAQKIVDILK